MISWRAFYPSRSGFNSPALLEHFRQGGKKAPEFLVFWRRSNRWEQLDRTRAVSYSLGATVVTGVSEYRSLFRAHVVYFNPLSCRVSHWFFPLCSLAIAPSPEPNRRRTRHRPNEAPTQLHGAPAGITRKRRCPLRTAVLLLRFSRTCLSRARIPAPDCVKLTSRPLTIKIRKVLIRKT